MYIMMRVTSHVNSINSFMDKLYITANTAPAYIHIFYQIHNDGEHIFP
jgi:hypothetical protein